MMRVALLYFAWVRELTGTGAETLEVPAGIATVGELAAWLRGRGAGYAEAFGDNRLRAAVDQVMAGFDAPIAGAREIAFFPPVTGG